MAATGQECSICMDSFKNPKLISCHHSFCYKCLDDYVRVKLSNGRFDCPLCRTSVELPKEGVQSFPTNHYIDTDSNVQPTCDFCGPNSVACCRCLDCTENFCQACSRVHEKLKACRQHKITDFGNLSLEVVKGKIRQKIFCDKHPEKEIELVCRGCNVLLCVLCKVSNHDTHPSKTIADAAAELQQRLEVKLYQCAEKLNRLDVCAQTGEDFKRKINDAEREELMAFEEQYSKLLQFLDQEAASTKDKIKCIYGELRNKNEAFSLNVQNESKMCCNANEKAKKLIDQGTHIEKIQNVPELELLLDEATSKSDPKHLLSLEKKLFAPATIVPSQLKSLIGVLLDSTKLGHDLAGTQRTSKNK